MKNLPAGLDQDAVHLAAMSISRNYGRRGEHKPYEVCRQEAEQQLATDRESKLKYECDAMRLRIDESEAVQAGLEQKLRYADDAERADKAVKHAAAVRREGRDITFREAWEAVS